MVIQVKEKKQAVDRANNHLGAKITETILNRQMLKQVESTPLAIEGVLEKLASDEEVSGVREDMVKNYPDLIMSAFQSSQARNQLVKLVQDEQRYGKEEKGLKKAEYVVDAIVGLGFIDQLMKMDPTITDIGWNGTFLTVESATQRRFYSAEQLQIKDPETAVFRIVKKFADAAGKPFSRTDPILDSVLGKIRLNAIHKVLSPAGTTFSLRMSSDRLALTTENFSDFAPSYVLDFLRVITKTGCMAIVGGETGSGKTEFMKLMLSFIPKTDRIFMIEDVPETHIKHILPENDIYSLVTGGIVSISDLVGASLRNYPKWIVPSETRGPEAYEMIQAARTGHRGVTSLHGPNCRSFPRRLVTMSGMGYAINETAVEEDVLTFVDFGFHIKTAYLEIDREKLIFQKIRYLSEIVEYATDHTTTLFKQTLKNGRFFVTTGKLSEDYCDRMGEYFIDFAFPELNKEVIEKSPELTALLETAVHESGTAYEN